MELPDLPGASRKKIFSLSFFTKIVGWSFLCSSVLAFIWISFAVAHNEQEQYCETIAYKATPRLEEGMFAKVGHRKFEPYDPVKHVNVKEFFILDKKTSYDISEANASSQNTICKITNLAFVEFFSIWLVFFLYVAPFFAASSVVLRFLKSLWLRAQILNNKQINGD